MMGSVCGASSIVVLHEFIGGLEGRSTEPLKHPVARRCNWVRDSGRAGVGPGAAEHQAPSAIP